eukprot:7366276-Karenia_brevis.AAC.1
MDCTCRIRSSCCDADVLCDALPGGACKATLSADDISQVLTSATSVDVQEEGGASEAHEASDSSECDSIGSDAADQPTAAVGAKDPQPPLAPKAAPPMNWMIYRGKTSGEIRIIQRDTYDEMWRQRLIKKLPAREQFLFQVGGLFGEELLRTPMVELSKPLAALQTQASGRLWGLKRDQLPFDLTQVMRSVPDELFAEISFGAFMQQYARLREWLQEVKAMPYGHEFFEPTGFLLKKMGLNDQPVGEAFEVDAKCLDANRWPPRVAPPLPTVAKSKKFGPVQ